MFRINMSVVLKLVLILSIFLPGKASCSPYTSCELYFKSDVIFVGKIVATYYTEWLDPEFGSYKSGSATFFVSEIIRNKSPVNVSVSILNNTNNICTNLLTVRRFGERGCGLGTPSVSSDKFIIFTEIDKSGNQIIVKMVSYNKEIALSWNCLRCNYYWSWNYYSDCPPTTTTTTANTTTHTTETTTCNITTTSTTTSTSTSSSLQYLKTSILFSIVLLLPT